MDCPVPGMESVVATVSGYHGLERFNLIKLISQAGASYVGAMSRSITHLVCWKFKGEKYNLAKKFNTIIVNHQWVEECIKQGKRVPEHPYMLQSGQELGPLSLEVRMPLSNKSNIFNNLERQKDLCSGDSGLVAWSNSFLLNENLFEEVEKGKGSLNKSKPRRAKKASKQKNCSSSRHHFRDPSVSALVSFEREGSSSDSSMHSVRDKRKKSRHEESLSPCSDMYSRRRKGKIADDIRSISLPEASCKGQRIVKKSVATDNSETLLLDSDQECYPIRSDSENGKTSTTSRCSNGKRFDTVSGNGVISDASLNNHGGYTSEAFDDIEEIRDWNHVPTTNDPKSCPEEAVSTLERPDECSNVEKLNRKVTRLPVSMELSCVICWTEFSSTRGILPCGHRFCYSCIQNWADHMASRRKKSTCPLCKASFTSIIKVDDAATSDQKIYSQTIPCASSTTDIFILTDQERQRFGTESSLATVCSACRCREPEDLLITCHLCQIRYIHSYCLDPPLLPWTCIHCKHLQMLYHDNNY